MSKYEKHIPLREAALTIDLSRGVVWLNTRTHCLLRICNVDVEYLKRVLEEEYPCIDLRVSDMNWGGEKCLNRCF